MLFINERKVTFLAAMRFGCVEEKGKERLDFASFLNKIKTFWNLWKKNISAIM